MEHIKKIVLRQCRFLGSYRKIAESDINFVMSVSLSIRPSEINYSVSTGRIFMKFDIRIFLENINEYFT